MSFLDCPDTLLLVFIQLSHHTSKIIFKKGKKRGKKGKKEKTPLYFRQIHCPPGLDLNKQQLFTFQEVFVRYLTNVDFQYFVKTGGKKRRINRKKESGLVLIFRSDVVPPLR